VGPELYVACFFSASVHPFTPTRASISKQYGIQGGS